MRGVAGLWLLAAAWVCPGAATAAQLPAAQLPAACYDGACFRKCCPPGATAGADDGVCVPLANATDDPTSRGFAPRVHRWPDLTPVDADLTRSVVLYGDPCSRDKYNLNPREYDDDEFYLLANGRLYVPGHNNVTNNVSQFCVEADGEDGEVRAFVCFMDREMSIEPQFIVYPIGMLVSLPFLLTTLVVYAVVPQLRNLHGRALMNYVVTLICSYVCLIVVQLFYVVMDPDLCIGLAFIIYFSFLASFFWLNVMCFDIWWTFSRFQRLRGSEKEREHKKFIIYSIYAWGCSMLLLLVCLLMDMLPGIPEHIVKPQIGTDRCWFHTRNAEAAYFYGPMAVIVVINTILFVLTAVRIVLLKRETAMLKGEESRRHDVEETKQRFVLYLKLFVVMGVNWGMEVISFLVGGPQYLWYIFDIGNTLQGVLIFLIFVWKEKIRRLLFKRLCPQMARGSTRSGFQLRGTLSKIVATPTSFFSLTTKATTNGISEVTRMTRDESDIV